MGSVGFGDYTAVAETWGQADAAACARRRAFDLVFVSMCPAVSDRAMLEKYLSCSRAFLCIMAFAGRRERQAAEAVRAALGLERRAVVPDDAFCMANLLYALGYEYKYECSIFAASCTEEMTADEARGLLAKTIMRQERMPSAVGALVCEDGVREAVDRYVSENCRDGVLNNTVENRHGRFLVPV